MLVTVITIIDPPTVQGDINTIRPAEPVTVGENVFGYRKEVQVLKVHPCRPLTLAFFYGAVPTKCEDGF